MLKFWEYLEWKEHAWVASSLHDPTTRAANHYQLRQIRTGGPTARSIAMHDGLYSRAPEHGHGSAPSRQRYQSISGSSGARVFSTARGIPRPDVRGAGRIRIDPTSESPSAVGATPVPQLQTTQLEINSSKYVV